MKRQLSEYIHGEAKKYSIFSMTIKHKEVNNTEIVNIMRLIPDSY